MKQAVIVVAVCCTVFAAIAYAQQGTRSTQSASTQPGRYQAVMGDDSGTMWRLDTVTGAASYCLTAQVNTNQMSIANGASAGRNMSCTPWMQ